MTPMTMAVASKVSQAENDNHKVNDQLLRRGPGIHALGATAFDDLLSSIEFVIAFPQQTAECMVLLGTTLEDITLDSPGNTDPSAGGDAQRAAVVIAAEELLRGDAWITAAGSPRPKGSDWTAGLGYFVGELLMTRPPG